MSIHKETLQKIDNEMGDVCQVIYVNGQLVQQWNSTAPDSGRTCPCLATSTQMLLDFAILGLVYHLCFLET